VEKADRLAAAGQCLYAREMGRPGAVRQRQRCWVAMSASDGVLGITLSVSGCLLAPEHGVEKAERWRWMSHGVLSVERGVAEVLSTVKMNSWMECCRW